MADPTTRDDGPPLVVCIRASTMPRPTVPGVARGTCGRCSLAVWISPSTAARFEGRPHELICQDCYLAEADDRGEIRAPDEAQLAEIRAACPGLGRAKLKRRLGTPARRRAALEKLRREAKARKRLEN